MIVVVSLCCVCDMLPLLEKDLTIMLNIQYMDSYVLWFWLREAVHECGCVTLSCWYDRQTRGWLLCNALLLFISALGSGVIDVWALGTCCWVLAQVRHL